ncbi:kazal domain protein [Candidatus Marinamargulisbacteria bacterium SCGC AG-414-C22]|nr:kazal domain protein [Candidatus Marinamargulisbacteria bacterium SCGC AG-414-C22]
MINMKKLKFQALNYTFLITILYLVSCDSDKNICINPADIDVDAVCTEVYDPVCGCNHITYANACQATKQGIQLFTEGECE